MCISLHHDNNSWLVAVTGMSDGSMIQVVVVVCTGCIGGMNGHVWGQRG